MQKNVFDGKAREADKIHSIFSFAVHQKIEKSYVFGTIDILLSKI